MRRDQRSGFTLLETAAVVGMVTLLLGVLSPAVKSARTQARGSASAANLMAIGQGSAMYALDHEGRIFNYTWRGPRPPETHVFFLMPDGKTRIATNDHEAASWQNTALLMERTGRITGETYIQNNLSRLAQHRMLLLVLMDYLDRPFPDPMVADPADANLLQWQANPTDIGLANNIPYAPGANTAGYDDPAGWTTTGARQRWAFTSSYMSTVSAWNRDGLPFPQEPRYVPVNATPHLFLGGGSNIRLADGRFYPEVVFPSGKVHFFEEFDRRQAGSPYFGYDHAAPLKLMFDGSLNDQRSGEAGPSWNPAIPNQRWRQRYVPLHTFPLPIGGFGDATLLSQRYRWTYLGLRGVDYPMVSPKDAMPVR